MGLDTLMCGAVQLQACGRLRHCNSIQPACLHAQVCHACSKEWMEGWGGVSVGLWAGVVGRAQGGTRGTSIKSPQYTATVAPTHAHCGHGATGKGAVREIWGDPPVLERSERWPTAAASLQAFISASICSAAQQASAQHSAARLSMAQQQCGEKAQEQQGSAPVPVPARCTVWRLGTAHIGAHCGGVGAPGG